MMCIALQSKCKISVTTQFVYVTSNIPFFSTIVFIIIRSIFLLAIFYVVFLTQIAHLHTCTCTQKALICAIFGKQKRFFFSLLRVSIELYIRIIHRLCSFFLFVVYLLHVVHLKCENLENARVEWGLNKKHQLL